MCDEGLKSEFLSASDSELKLEKFRSRISISNLSPQVDCGRFPVKQIVGDTIEIRADVVKPGHDKLAVWLNHRPRKKEQSNWVTEIMEYEEEEDYWFAEFSLPELGTYEYFVEAWTDSYSSKVEKFKKWVSSGETDANLELDEIVDIMEKAATNASAYERSLIRDNLEKLDHVSLETALQIFLDPNLSRIVAKNIGRNDYSASNTLGIIVDREIARYSTWYELFPRSQGTILGKSGTLKDTEARLPEIQRMGFDVLYLAPIHPIGRTNRRGANNTPSGGNDPGSPWAIGNEIGGHKTIDPELGTMQDFASLMSRARDFGIEIALDVAFQVSPDHPYVKEHPEWFLHRKDGSIRFAENPPKKYFDIYPLNFENPNWKELWLELRNIVQFWIDKGVRIFRVDNPHTKPIGFWEWLIQSIREDHPDVIFLAEAFTRPKSMKLLAKLGFDQSYTYFTWKNSKKELIDFLDEYLLSDVKEYYRGNFFTNTPDILHEYLQKGGLPAFKIRLVLAATLCSSYGIYSGFELIENKPLREGSEEYLDSEKYQNKVWDWDRPSNIKEFISKVNSIRKNNPALHETSNLRLLDSTQDEIFFYGKWTEDLSNVILVAVNLDPFSARDGTVSVPIKSLGLDVSSNYRVKDLITESVFDWHGEKNYVRLDPKTESAHILLLQRN